MTERLMLLILEALCGFLPQSIAVFLGMHAHARRSIRSLRGIVSIVVCTLFVMVIRYTGVVSFGLHILAWLLVANLLAIIYCRLDIRASVTSSLLMAIFIMLGEGFDLLLVLLFNPGQDLNALMLEPIPKILWSLPGTLLVLLAMGIYYFWAMRHPCPRAKAGKKDGKQK